MRPSPWIAVAVVATLAWACVDFDSARTEFCDGNTICDDGGVDAGPPNYVFVTSIKVAPGGLGGVGTADAICQGLASKANLRGTYRAWLPAGSTESAISRLQGARGWIRPDGRPSIDQITDNGLTNKSLHPPILTENGTLISGDHVFTGTNKSGDVATGATCEFWTKNTDDAGTLCGDPSLVAGGDWTDYYSCQCNVPARLYCFGIDRNTPLNIPQPAASRRAFVTGTGYSSGGGLRGADDLCRREASVAGLQGTYLAFLGSTGQSPGSRFNANGPNWYRVDNIPIAATPGELLDAGPGWVPLAALSLTADGGTYMTGGAWTGADSPSTVVTNSSVTACADWTSTTATGYYALLHVLGFVKGGTPCANPQALYCLQE